MFLDATITCPKCGFSKEEKMPECYLETAYTCQNCQSILVPKEGDCCVYCSYSNTVCPVTQEKRNCCSDYPGD